MGNTKAGAIMKRMVLTATTGAIVLRNHATHALGNVTSVE